jgi:hypothetical protein
VEKETNNQSREQQSRELSRAGASPAPTIHGLGK